MSWKVGKGEIKRTGKRRTRRNFTVRKRVIVPYGRELNVRGIK